MRGKIFQRTSAFFELLRPLNCAMVGFAVLIGELIALGGDLRFLPSVLGFVTAYTLTGSSMSINDYFDRFVDAVNEPTRPIPSGRIEPKRALEFACLLGLVGLVSALLTGLWALLIASLFYAISAFYNAHGKKYGLLGNFMVSGCVAIPFVYGAVIVGFFPGIPLLLFASMAFCSNTGREVIKGIADIEGDRLRGVVTLAMSRGPKRAALIATLFNLMAIGIVFLPPVLHLVHPWYLPFAGVACVGCFTTTFSALKNPTARNARRSKNLMLVWMGFGLLAFTLGGLPLG